MYDIVSVGEGMLRLSPPKFERLRRAKTLDVQVCGSQGNVASNMARLGDRAAFVTKLPDSALGLLMLDHYMSCGVDVSHIAMSPDSRLGVNYIEFGATPRASAVVYDRKNSAASTISPGDFDWDKILNGTRLAYTDGILPGLSECCRESAFEFIAAAKRQKCLIGFDINYREHLWSYEEARGVLSKILPNVDILITSQWHSEAVFGIKGTSEEILQRFHDQFGCKIVAITLREMHSVERGAWNTMVLNGGKQILLGRRFEMDEIDRFGAGDSWDSGFFHAYLETGDAEYAMNFGNALCALQHTIPGDVAHVTVDEVKAILESNKYVIRR